MSPCQRECDEVERLKKRFHLALHNGAAVEKHRARWQKALHTYLVCRGISNA